MPDSRHLMLILWVWLRVPPSATLCNCRISVICAFASCLEDGMQNSDWTGSELNSSVGVWLSWQASSSPDGSRPDEGNGNATREKHNQDCISLIRVLALQYDH